MTSRPNPLEERLSALESANARRTEFENIVAKDRRIEWRLLWSEVVALILLIDFAIWALSLSTHGR